MRYVYVIGPMEGLQKVGMATDPRSRLAALQTASPVDLMVHASIAVPFGVAPDVEHQAHKLLARACVRNEWFRTTPAEAVAAVYAAAMPWLDKPRSSSASGAPVLASLRMGRVSRGDALSPAAPPARRDELSVELLPLFRRAQQALHGAITMPSLAGVSMMREVWFRQASGGRYVPIHWKGTVVVLAGMLSGGLGFLGHYSLQGSNPTAAGWCLGFSAASILITIGIGLLHSG